MSGEASGNGAATLAPRVNIGERLDSIQEALGVIQGAVRKVGEDAAGVRAYLDQAFERIRALEGREERSITREQFEAALDRIGRLEVQAADVAPRRASRPKVESELAQDALLTIRAWLKHEGDHRSYFASEQDLAALHRDLPATYAAHYPGVSPKWYHARELRLYRDYVASLPTDQQPSGRGWSAYRLGRLSEAGGVQGE